MSSVHGACKPSARAAEDIELLYGDATESCKQLQMCSCLDCRLFLCDCTVSCPCGLEQAHIPMACIRRSKLLTDVMDTTHQQEFDLPIPVCCVVAWVKCSSVLSDTDLPTSLESINDCRPLATPVNDMEFHDAFNDTGRKCQGLQDSEAHGDVPDEPVCSRELSMAIQVCVNFLHRPFYSLLNIGIFARRRFCHGHKDVLRGLWRCL